MRKLNNVDVRRLRPTAIVVGCITYKILWRPRDVLTVDSNDYFSIQSHMYINVT